MIPQDDKTKTTPQKKEKEPEYRELCEKLRTMNEEDLEKVSIFIGWIEKKE